MPHVRTGHSICSASRVKRMKKKNTKIGSSFGVTVDKAFCFVFLFLLSISASMRLWRSPALCSGSGRQEGSVRRPPNSRYKPALAVRGRVAAFHCVQQDGASMQQHTEEPMALGGIRSRSSSSGISSSR